MTCLNIPSQRHGCSPTMLCYTRKSPAKRRREATKGLVSTPALGTPVADGVASTKVYSDTCIQQATAKEDWIHTPRTHSGGSRQCQIPGRDHPPQAPLKRGYLQHQDQGQSNPGIHQTES